MAVAEVAVVVGVVVVVVVVVDVLTVYLPLFNIGTSEAYFQTPFLVFD